MSNVKSTPIYEGFQALIEARHSTREYISDPISKAEIEAVLEAARIAPSACNRQPWRFYVVTNQGKRAAMLAKSRPGFMDAPVLIVAIGLHSEAWHRPSDGKDHTDIDVSIAVEHICLAAQALDLASCWVCSFDTEAVRKELALKDGEEPIALIPIGRANGAIPAKIRKPLADIVRYEE